MQTYAQNQWPAATFRRAIDLEATRRVGTTDPCSEQLRCARDYVLANWLDQVAPAGTA